MNKWVSVGISALSDFILTAATGYVTAATMAGTAIVPSVAAIIVCGALGLLAAARGVQKTLSPPP